MKKNSLLYAYKIQHDNRFTYAFTMELAKRLDLEVVTFTSIDSTRLREAFEEEKIEYVSNEKRKIFTHLLSLHGYYQVFYNQWSPDGNPVSKNLIENGSFNDCLITTIKNEHVACVIIDPAIRQGISRRLEQDDKTRNTIRDIPFMVLPGKVIINSNEPLPELSSEEEKDAFLDSVIGDSDLFTLFRQNELTNS